MAYFHGETKLSAPKVQPFQQVSVEGTKWSNVDY
jgi:hypothetical protein